jgi:peroxidase
MVNEPASRFDTNFADTLQNHLFEFRLSDGSVVAIDLAATNINRGRDHGLPGYNSFRERCGFPRVRSFQELADLISPDKIQALQSVYE